METHSEGDNSHSGGRSPGKIFVGGLAKDTTHTTFKEHFARYGEIKDSIIPQDRYTGQSRGFGFVTYADPSVVGKVMEGDHVINGKQVEIKRTIPKNSNSKKVFVGGLPSTLTEDELSSFFSKFGKVVECHIIRNRETNRSRGFGFIIFEDEEFVNGILIHGNTIDMYGTLVEIKKAEPKKANNPPPGPSYGGNPRCSNDGFGGFGGPYGGFNRGFGFGPNRNAGDIGGRLGGEFGYRSVGVNFVRGSGGYGNSSLGLSRCEAGSTHFGPYRGGHFGGGGFGWRGQGGHGQGSEEGHGSYSGPGYGGGYVSDLGSGSGSGSGGAGGVSGREDNSGSSHYGPYPRSG